MGKEIVTTKEKPAHEPTGLIILQCQECGTPFKKSDVDEYMECSGCGHTYYNPNWATEKETIIEKVTDPPPSSSRIHGIYQQPSWVMCVTTDMGYYSTDSPVGYAMSTGFSGGNLS